MAQFLRFNEMAGVRPRLPRRLRIAAITAAAPSHMSRQVAASVAVGVHRILTLDVTAAVERLVEDLNGFRPDVVHAFPSVAARLAEEQTAGRLRIAPAVLTTASDLRTPEMVERISEAFGVDPFDLYGTTEGLWACECDRHRGMHVFEDATIIENVDVDGRPVPPGEPGARLLVTNLYNRVQPIIRLAVADAATMDPEPCPCGRTLLRIRSIDGRSDDVLELPGAGGRRVTVHPLPFAVVARDREVREFQVVREETGICILVVPANGVGPGLEDRVRTAVAQRLGELGVTGVRISIERRDALERTPGGKLQMVVDRSRSPHEDHVAAQPTGRKRHGGYE